MRIHGDRNGMTYVRDGRLLIALAYVERVETLAMYLSEYHRPCPSLMIRTCDKEAERIRGFGIDVEYMTKTNRRLKCRRCAGGLVHIVRFNSCQLRHLIDNPQDNIKVLSVGGDSTRQSFRNQWILWNEERMTNEG